ncbi:hypothetical protein Rsub_04400 [Raphidocelis subcapitata]|uniref:Uncharacterized protein n=1 Tax=Raphidocelis subcapitata TaxID=307507 RepID=A0A2V0P2I3_9CHLO|nr:hypothetical protein Rsub_04400 [Raphidocelis subcapitata]|eukprot:GBF92053.1 hypothetical protein Rsub_04400 [Raphidocelis subcapitata]
MERQDSESQQGRFKVVGKVVMAMQRFKASINPTYHYAKRPTDPDASHDAALRAVQAQRTGAGARDRTASGRTVSGRPTSAGQAHGHKGDLLFRHLPEVETEAQ